MHKHLVFASLPVAALASCATADLPPASRGAFSTPGVVTDADARAWSPPVREELPARNKPWEFTVGGAGASNDDFDAGNAQVAATAGYYVNDVVEFSFRQNGWFSDAGPDTSDQWNGASRVAIDLHAPLGRIQPYVGANVGYVYGDSVKETMVGGPEAGVKFYLQDDAFLQAGAEYQFFFDTDDSLDAVFDDGQMLYALTMGLRF